MAKPELVATKPTTAADTSHTTTQGQGASSSGTTATAANLGRQATSSGAGLANPPSKPPTDIRYGRMTQEVGDTRDPGCGCTIQ